jgi:hypothetical protein
MYGEPAASTVEDAYSNHQNFFMQKMIYKQMVTFK